MLITEESTDGQHYVGHNKYYDQVLIKKSQCMADLMGAMVTVTVTNTDKHYIIATPLSSNFNLIPMVTIAIVILIVAMFLYAKIF